MRKLLALLIIGIVSNAFNQQANAESSSGIKVISTTNLSDIDELIGDTPQLAAVVKNARYRSLDRSIKFRIRANGIGRLDAELDTQKFFNIKDRNSAFLQGAVINHSENSDHKFPGFATIEGLNKSEKKLRLFFMTQSRKKAKGSWKGLLELRAVLKAQDDKVIISGVSLRRSKRGKMDKIACMNNKKHSSPDASFSHEGPSTKAQVKIAKILIESDFEYQNQLDGAFSTEIATIMNGVDTIYQRDLGLSFDTNITEEPIGYTAPIQYVANDTIALHNEMKIARPAATRGSDIHFLFTGKAPIGSDLQDLAGIVVDLGTVCSRPEDSVGLAIRIDTATDIVVASHEIGHLYNAEHDDDFTTSAHIMSSAVDGSIKSFSSYSKSQVASYVNSDGSCLSGGEGNGGGGGSTPGTLPATALVDAYKDGKYFILELYDGEDDSGFSDYSIDILYRAKAKNEFQVLRQVTTDEDGVAFFRPKKTGLYAFRVETLQSRQLKFKKK